MTHVEETIAAAAHIEHPWDAQALDWPLTPESVVVEVGGYKGRWALQIAERYHPRLFVFEPQPWAKNVCKAVLAGHRALVLPIGLGVTTEYAPMGEWETDGCSFVKDGVEGAWMREIGIAFQELEIDHIDLMLMNIEGYEYTLIPHMIAQGILPQRLMVQMHSFAGDSDALRTTLAQHYRLRWDYGDVLSAWERNKNAKAS